MRVKICGIRSLAMARVAIQSHCWALGFNFHAPSPRYISMARAHEICQQLPSSVTTVGVYTGNCEKTVEHLLSFMDKVQLYHPHLAVDKKRCILALSCADLRTCPAHEVLAQFAYVLLDAPRSPNGALGGTGKLANWQLAKELAAQHPLIIAGGLHADNVQDAIQFIQPSAVDVASGVETHPGKQNKMRMKNFLRSAHNVKA